MAIPRNFTSSAEQDPIPLVPVEGFLGRGTAGYWGPLEPLLDEVKPGANSQKRKILYVHLGTVSSLHDRACELYYQIKGGRVDYGERHTETHRHGRYGRTYPGLYPQWSKEHPVHFLGHSYGGVTVWYLQQLLIRGYFSKLHSKVDAPDDIDDHMDKWKWQETPLSDSREFEASEGDWIRSITTISSPFRGTTSTYILGEREDIPAKVRALSFGSFLYRLVHVYLYLDLPLPIRNFLYDFNVDHWGFGRRRFGRATEHEEPFSTLAALYRNLSCSEWAEGRDCAPYDLTVRRMEWVNSRSSICTRTHYQSFAASMTSVDRRRAFHIPKLYRNIPLFLLSFFIGRHEFHDPVLIEEISGAAGDERGETPDSVWYRGNEEDDPAIPHHTSSQTSLDRLFFQSTRPIPSPGRYRPFDWRENDGLCPTMSQSHPGACHPSYCTCSQGSGPRTSFYASVSNVFGGQILEPGIWNAHYLPSTSHVDIVPDLQGVLGGRGSLFAKSLLVLGLAYEVTLDAAAAVVSSVKSCCAIGGDLLRRFTRPHGRDRVPPKATPSDAHSDDRQRMVLKFYLSWLAAIDEKDHDTKTRKEKIIAVKHISLPRSFRR